MILKIISPFAADPRSTLFSCPEVPENKHPETEVKGVTGVTVKVRRPSRPKIDHD